jgi:NADH:ubiquinone oxidoreductase subunit 4 (subunit M)
MVQRVAFGVPPKGQASHLSDLNWRETAILIPLAILVFWIGVYPSPLLAPMHQTVNRLVERIDHDKGGPVARGKGQEDGSQFAARHSPLAFRPLGWMP